MINLNYDKDNNKMIGLIISGRRHEISIIKRGNDCYLFNSNGIYPKNNNNNDIMFEKINTKTPLYKLKTINTIRLQLNSGRNNDKLKKTCGEKYRENDIYFNCIYIKPNSFN